MNNNQKATKRALLTSVMALVMCVVMLVGTTFAWFTDTASTGVNKIVSGNLKVDIIGENSDSHIETLNFTKAGTVVGTDAAAAILWEPGCRYLTEGFRIANNGNLALKWKAEINKGGARDGKVAGSTIAKDGKSLLDVIDFYVVTSKEENAEAVKIEDFTGNLTAGAKSGVYYIKGVMQTTAGNDYQDLTLDGITITVYATQDTVENDSFNNQYDKDATYLTYPADVTTDSFPENASYINDQGQTKSDKPATVAFVDKNGATQYAADLNTAITNGASVVYCKKDAKLVGSLTRGNNRTGELTSDLTIYANGADFQNTEISINATSLSTESVGKTKNFTLRVNDAKNIRIWGATPNDGVTQDIILENCTFEGKGINSVDDVASGGIFYLTGSTGTVNLTMNNCKVSGSNQGVYLGCNGNITVTNSAFEECAAGMKISHKATGVCNVTVKDTTFNKCGCDTAVAEKPWLTNDSSSIKCKTKGTMTLTLDNVAINNVVGNDGIVVDGDTDYTGKTTVSATNVTVDGAAWSANTTNP